MKEKNLISVAAVHEKCFSCLKELNNEIILNTKLSEKNAKKVEKMHGQCIGFAENLCEECIGHTLQGIILITVDHNKTEDMGNPYRTGGWFLVTEKFVKEAFGDTSKELLEKRIGLIEHEAAVILGLIK